MTSPDALPESMTLKPSTISWLLVMLGSAGLGTLGLQWLGSDSDTAAWAVPLGILLGSTGLSVSLLMLWPNSSWIKLGPDGIRLRVLFRNFHHRWGDINGFGITTLHTGYGNKSRLVTFWVGPNNTPHSLPSGFGKKPDDLMELLERYWQRYR